MMQPSVLRAAPVAVALWVLAACGPRPAVEHPTVARLAAYDCEEGLALLVFGERSASSIEVRWGDRSSRLERVRDEDGLVHSDGRTTLTQRGDEASLTPAGGAPLVCRRRERARRIEHVAAEGALLWAGGNEPGWLLVLYPDRFVWEADYGESHYEGPVTPGPVAPGIRTFEATPRDDVGASIRIEIRRGLCRDGMSGAAFGAEVTILRDGETYRGCGLLLGPDA
jgi:uncharacterized membrane protein